MHRYSLYSTEIEGAFSAAEKGRFADDLVRSLLEDPRRSYSLPCTLLAREKGAEVLVRELSEHLSRSIEGVADVVCRPLDEAISKGFFVSGAEAVALILREAMVATAFSCAGE